MKILRQPSLSVPPAEPLCKNASSLAARAEEVSSGRPHGGGWCGDGGGGGEGRGGGGQPGRAEVAEGGTGDWGRGSLCAGTRPGSGLGSHGDSYGWDGGRDNCSGGLSKDSDTVDLFEKRETGLRVDVVVSSVVAVCLPLPEVLALFCVAEWNRSVSRESWESSTLASHVQPWGGGTSDVQKTLRNTSVVKVSTSIFISWWLPEILSAATWQDIVLGYSYLFVCWQTWGRQSVCLFNSNTQKKINIRKFLHDHYLYIRVQ